jgi:hypothetical protein
MARLGLENGLIEQRTGNVHETRTDQGNGHSFRIGLAKPFNGRHNLRDELGRRTVFTSRADTLDVLLHVGQFGRAQLSKFVQDFADG